MTVHEFILPDVLTPIYLTRQYLSTGTGTGWLGKGWHFSYEGRLCHDEKTGIIHAELPDGYCAAYEPVWAEDEAAGEVYRDVAGNGKYTLSHDRAAELWNITDTHSFRTYCYNGEGLLISVGIRTDAAWRSGTAGSIP